MFEKLAEGLFALYSPNEGANSFLLVGKKTALIDSSLEVNAGLIKNSLKEIGLKPDDIELVLHTHGHCDHFGADALFKHAEIRMSEFDASYVNFKDGLFTASNLLGNSFFPKIKSFFKEKEKISLGFFGLSVLQTPGHTKGSVCFFDEKNKLLFSGDLLFKDAAGRYDFFSGNRADLLNSLALVEKLSFKLLLPGHGLVFSENQKANIRKARDSLF